MKQTATTRRDAARVALGVIRVVNGVTALTAPKMVMRRLGVDAAANPAAVYGLRMFGIRTVLIGLDILSSDPQVRQHAVRVAPVIHGSDTLSAVAAGVASDIPARSTVLATAISAANLTLAVMAQRAHTARNGRGRVLRRVATTGRRPA